MILDELVKIKWHSSNKKYLIDRGYIFTKIDDEILIKIIDLKSGSHILVHVKCDVCGCEKELSYKAYNKNIKSGGYYGCSNECSINKVHNTNIKLYGDKFPMNNILVKEKTKNTNLRKYGVGCALQSKIAKDKGKTVMIERYGTEHYSQSNEYKENNKIHSLEKYGVDSYFKTDEFKLRTKTTNLERYGTPNPASCDSVKNKMKRTNIDKYGVEYAIQSDMVKAKIKNTMKKRYGVENITMNKIYSDKAKNTMIERYGELWLRHTPTYNANSIIYLDLLSQMLSLPIQHALNGGEKKFVKYFIDGYIEEYNICIEWDERYHRVKKFKENDIIREEYLKENFSCHIIRIDEIEFLKDVDNQLINVANKINDIIKLIS